MEFPQHLPPDAWIQQAPAAKVPEFEEPVVEPTPGLDQQVEDEVITTIPAVLLLLSFAPRTRPWGFSVASLHHPHCMR